MILLVSLRAEVSNILNGFGIEEDSPYPEVRSAVSNTDDIRIPVSTFRAWLIGMEMKISSTLCV